MKVYFDRKVLIGFFLALGILILLGVYSYKNSQESIKTSGMVSHTNDVLYRIEQLHSIHLEIEAQWMRYVTAGDSTFAPFFQARLEDATNHFVVLQNLLKDNKSQERYLDSIRMVGREKVDLILKTIKAGSQSDDAIDIALSDTNKKLVGRIKDAVGNMEAVEKMLLNQRMSDHQHEVKMFNITLISLLVGTVLIILMLFLAINSTLRARIEAEQALVTASAEIKDLYNKAPCGYHSLNDSRLIVEMNKTWLNWTGYHRSEVINKMRFTDLLTPGSKEIFETHFAELKLRGDVSNVELEVSCKNKNILFVVINATAIRDQYGNFIKSRSTVFDITARHQAEQKVVAINNELEAFTYSVSHDLRAPLRSIDGYSKILQEDYGSKMDSEANRLLDIIKNNARRMGQLIDDLLDFSRLGRKELEKSMVNMEALVTHVQQELVSQEKGRKIQFKINRLEGVNGDARMMRQVWINLISNAIKYSRMQEVATIEIGSSIHDNRVVYFIRDNGVGFDMKYADKLFGVFQRLHKVQEFEGTGVGLALAHRIVSRHGGKIWVEAGVNQGATFFFFIPTQNQFSL
jgi:PAS domain S-box-containing protein